MSGKRTPQVMITLSPESGLQAELAWAGGRRKIALAEASIWASLLRMLHAQLRDRVAIGEDGAPTQAQVRHWERHQVFPDERCGFCVDEGRISSGASRQRAKKTLLAKHGDVEIRRVAKAKGPAIGTSKKLEDLGL